MDCLLVLWFGVIFNEMPVIVMKCSEVFLPVVPFPPGAMPISKMKQG